MIQIENLEFKYPNNNEPTLKRLNFQIDTGEIFGFLGPSGAGKSTTQKIRYKILNDYAGNVIIDQKNIKDWDNSYFEKIGVGFELPNHYLKLTGKENMDLFASFYKNGTSRNISELFEIQPFYTIGLVDNLVISFLTALTVPLYVLSINAIVKNRMQGMVYIKAFNMIVLIPIVAFFVPENFKHVFGVLPTHWIFQSIDNLTNQLPILGLSAIGFLFIGVLIWLASRQFIRKHFV